MNVPHGQLSFDAVRGVFPGFSIGSFLLMYRSFFIFQMENQFRFPGFFAVWTLRPERKSGGGGAPPPDSTA